MFSTLISLWSYHLSRAELARTREVSETLRAALLRGERGYFWPQNLAGFGMLDWFAGSFDSAVNTLATATDDLAEAGGKSDISAIWFVPNDATVAMHVHLALARFMAADLGCSMETVMAHYLSNHIAVAYGDIFGEMVALSQGLGFKVRVLRES